MEKRETVTKVDKPIWEMAQELTQHVVEDKLSQLPANSAEQYDHYIYGTPKRETGRLYSQALSTQQKIT